MRRAWVGWCLFAAAFACAPAAGLAHKPSDSYLSLHLDGATVQGRWDIALRDLEFVLGIDADGDGNVTWGELRARHGAIAAYALARLAIRDGGAECPTMAQSHLVEEHSDGAYAVLRFSGTCAGVPRTLDISYDLLFDADAQHRGLLKLDAFGRTTSAIFSAQERTRNFAAAGGDAPRQLAMFVADGIKHIAIGVDHILFLVALLLPAVLVREGRRWKPTGSLRSTLWNVFGIVTAFTAAHSITLSAAVLGFVSVPSRWVESLIAASVVLTALDNVFPFLPRRRWLIAFAFGLLHGLGFASVLLDLGLPASSLALALLGFNVGVELGQLALVALLLPLSHGLRDREAYARYGVAVPSMAIAFVALGWLVERALDLRFMPF